ncbi:MAG: hypothetical protein MUF83_13115 [Acidimicrobiales bacterium]|nr:hypothetical protein [Acidimicrobiales bacterium]
MGLFDANWERMAAILRELLTPLLAPGEELVGAVQANQQKTFSAKLFAVGVTPQRLIVVPVNRKWQPTGDPPRSVTRADITGCSVWGWGGSVRDFLSASADQQIRIQTADESYKWMVLGGNLLENSLAGADHLRGLDALIEFVLSARR